MSFFAVAQIILNKTKSAKYTCFVSILILDLFWRHAPYTRQRTLRNQFITHQNCLKTEIFLKKVADLADDSLGAQAGVEAAVLGNGTNLETVIKT